VSELVPEIIINSAELLQGEFQILHDLGGDQVGGGEVFRILKAFILQSEYSQAHLVPLDQFVI